MVYIYTENLFVLNKIKNFIKILLGRQNRGPKAVEDSLLRGFQELGSPYKINSHELPIDTACVISGSQTLRWAVEQKNKSLIKKIIAGPNLVVSPDDAGGILKHPLVDVIVAPSAWVREYYCQIDPSLKERVKIWPAGVSLPQPLPQEKSLDFLIYNKIANLPLLKEVVGVLGKKNFSFKILTYGKFKQNDYFKILAKAKYEIYLSKSESQGLAMFEAWARNVATLVWETGEYKNHGTKIMGQISAPFLSPEAGMSFGGRDDFEKKLEVFIRTDFSPRAFVEENFTNKICSQKYLDILYGQ